MRIAIAVLVTGVLAMPLAGAAGPVVRPAEITIRAGESAVLSGYQGAGGLSQGFPYHYDFLSDDPDVAIVRGFASGTATSKPDPLPENGQVFVRAMQAGTAHVRATMYPLDLATIKVLPRIGPVEIHADTTHVKVGEHVILVAVLPGYDGAATFAWYRGRIGDTTSPIQTSTDPQLAFVAKDLGPSYLWVQAVAGPVASSAEVLIVSAAPPRRRTARH